MPLDEEIKLGRKEIVTVGYEMSLGELMSLYKDKELIINPAYQRLFRWTPPQKTKFIESILIGIPIPPIFVFQNESGVWELVDGLQRLSTVFEFAGILRLHDGSIAPPSVLDGTKLLPSLANKTWEADSIPDTTAIGREQQLELRRARMRVEILKKESDPLAKFELFQRLNTGGSNLSEQEVRNAVLVMANDQFYNWLVDLAHFPDFARSTSQTQRQLSTQNHVELALRIIIYRNLRYQRGLDVHEFLDDAAVRLAMDPTFNEEHEGDVFRRTFGLLVAALDDNAFKRWDGKNFSGAFSISAYEVIAYGLSLHIDEVEVMPEPRRSEFITERVKNVWADQTFQRNSGAGVRGTTRLNAMLPIAGQYFKP